MDVKFDGIVGLLKLPSYIMGALAIAGGVLLFLPESVIKSLYMTGFRDEYGFTIGIVFVISTSILVMLFVNSIYKLIRKKFYIIKLKIDQVKFLKKLSDEKVSLINAFLREPTHTLVLPMNDGLVIQMRYYNVISPAGQTHLVSMLEPQINYFLQPWVEERIRSDDELRKKYNC